MALHKCEHCNGILWERTPMLKRIWDYVQENTNVTSLQVSEALGVTVQNANNQLNRLRHAGLLSVEVNSHPSGGRVNTWIVNVTG